MGLSCSPGIHKEKMAELIANITNVLVYQEDMLIITHGEFVDHLQLLFKVFDILLRHNLQINTTKSSF
jgi:hypothetical protein